MLTLGSLESSGALVNGTPIKKTISFKTASGEVSGEIWVRQLSVADYMTAIADYKDTDDESQKMKYVKAIVTNYIVLGEDASERITEEHADRMTPSLLHSMIDAFNEVNGIGEEKN